MNTNSSFSKVPPVFPPVARPKLRGDKGRSTYRWEIYLSNGIVLDGYSAVNNHAENADKELLFNGIVARLMNNGYLDKSYILRFFKQSFSGRDNDELVLQMNADGYELSGCFINNPIIETFLMKVFTVYSNSEPYDYKKLLPARGQSYAEKRDFPNFDTFKSYQQLIDHCKRVKASGMYDETRIIGYFKTIRRERFPEQLVFTNVPTETNPQPPTYTTLLAQQKAEREQKQALTREQLAERKAKIYNQKF